MSRSFPLLIGIVVLMPLAADAPDSGSKGDPGETRLRVGGGVGQYAFIARDCDGAKLSELPVDAVDLGAAAEHRFAGKPLTVGVRGGWTHNEPGTLWERNPDPYAPAVPRAGAFTVSYINPYAALEWRRFGIGAGWIEHDRPLPFGTNDPGTSPQDNPDNGSAHVRIGPRDGVHFQASYLEGVPIYSDGGYFNFGMGFPVSNARLFVGGTAGPMDRMGTTVGLDYPLTPALRAGIRGQSNFDGAGNVGLALEYRIPH